MDGLLKKIRGTMEVFRYMARYGYPYLVPVAVFKKVYYKIILRPFDIDPWFSLPAEARPYSMDIVHFFNKNLSKESVVVEIGCGIGDILNKFKTEHRVGLDINPEIIRAAICLNRGNQVKFLPGTFTDVKNLGFKKIDLLLCVGFSHQVSPEAFRDELHALLRDTEVDSICVDVIRVPDGWEQDFSKIIPPEYKLVEEKYYPSPIFKGPTNLIYSKKELHGKLGK